MDSLTLVCIGPSLLLEKLDKWEYLDVSYKLQIQTENCGI